MKTRFLCALLCVFATANAQRAATENAGALPTQTPRDVLKLNLAALAVKNVSLQYEYLLGKRVSLAFGLRVMPTTAIPFDTQLGKTLANNNRDAQDLLNVSRLGNVALTPELRYYFGKGWGRGFYAAPYYRFASFTSNTFVVNYSASNGPKRSLTLNGELSAHTAGLLLGAQWFLGKAVVLDWWIAGAQYGVANGRFLGTPSPDFSESEQAAVQKNLNDLEVPFTKKTVTTTPRSVEVKTAGAFGGVRAGLCLGVRF